MTTVLPIYRHQPTYCEYAAGPCDQVFQNEQEASATFLYSSKSTQIAATIESAIIHLRNSQPQKKFTSWRDYPTAGQIIFCSICKSVRFAGCVVADVTTLNFNLLFEIGYAIGIGQGVIPIRDATIQTSAQQFKDFGMLDTLGYLDFQNSKGLADDLATRLPVQPLAPIHVEINRDCPVYVVKGHIATEGDVRLMSVLARSALEFRTFDILETPRLSLQDARRQVQSSLAVVVHLMSPERSGAIAHNARCALVAGLAMAAEKQVLMLQEDVVVQPIDYRDVVTSYTSPQHVQTAVEPFLREVIRSLQDGRLSNVKTPEGFLERLDLGDMAAENETRALRNYFVRTSQFTEAKRGMARLVVGRKGSGKTALFYGVRDSVPKGHKNLVLELKPEGHQFTKFREVVLSKLSLGIQEHTLTAFWNYLLLCEIAETIRESDYSWAQRDEERWKLFQEVLRVYGSQVPADSGDFSERLFRQVQRMSDRFEGKKALELATAGELTQALFSGEIKTLDNVLAPYLKEKDDVWVLVDNLDKGWPTRGTRSADILILRTLLEATRKLQRQLDQRGVGFHALVFLRNDIYEHLLLETPDRGKDTAIALEWDDIEVFRELVLQRVRASTGLRGTFEEVWPHIAEPFIGTQGSFRYIVERTLMRPRDLLAFLQRAVGVAINRGHSRISASDLEKAEEGYSEDMLVNLVFELRDVFPERRDVPYLFAHSSSALTASEVYAILADVAPEEMERDEIIELLLWFGFLGVQEIGEQAVVFAYQVRYSIEKLLSSIQRNKAKFVIHNAFHKALSVRAR